MNNIDIFGTKIYNIFSKKIYYDGNLFYLIDENEQYIPMREATLLSYLRQALKDEYYADHLFNIILENYLLNPIKKEFYNTFVL
jgi:hypothetical protein